jgi:hypothetical protein
MAHSLLNLRITQVFSNFYDSPEMKTSHMQMLPFLIMHAQAHA